jgi:hypothetical protein
MLLIGVVLGWIANSKLKAKSINMETAMEYLDKKGYNVCLDTKKKK